MTKSLRQALSERREEYLFRTSIFDWLECPVDVDFRTAYVRRFLSGGDDVDPANQNFEPKPVTRPKLFAGTEADDANFRRFIHGQDKHQDNRSDESDFDQFALPNFGEIDLNRVTAQLTRASEQAKAGNLRPAEQVFDLRVSMLPKLDETKDVLPRAWALLVLAGYDENALKNPVVGGLDATDWTVDAWNGKDKLQLRPHLERELWGRLYGFMNENRVSAQKCAREDSPGKSDPDPVVPEELPNGPASAMASATEAFVAAFGAQPIDDLVSDLRALKLSEPLVARLLLWLEASWNIVPDFMRPGIATARWREIYDPPPKFDDQPDSPTATAPPEDEGHSDLYEGQRETREKWKKVSVALYMLRYLGRIESFGMRDACLRLHAMERAGLFVKMQSTLDKYLDAAVPQWPYAEGLHEVMCTALWDDPLYSRPDLPFLITASLADSGLISKRYVNDAGDTAPLLLPQATLDPLGAFYWRHVVCPSTFKHILGIPDTADFHVADHLRFLGLFRPGGRVRPAQKDGTTDPYEQWMQSMLPQWFVDYAIAALLKFKYWISDPATDRDDEEEMNFWSENHQALFASAEYIAGQWFGELTFKRTQQPGLWHKERAEKRMERWLHDRLRFGFCELNSPVYYNEHLPAIFNMVDFVEDERLRTLATMVLDLMVFDIVRRTCQGSFLAATSRVYADKKSSGWCVSILDFVQLITAKVGDFVGSSEAACVFCITSRYMNEVPEALLAIPHDASGPMVDRSRVSIDLSEADEYGVGFESGEDVIFWWGHSAYFTDETYRLSQSWAVRWNLHETSVFKLFWWIDNIVARVVGTLIEAAELAALFTLAPALGFLFYARLARFVFDAIGTFLDLIASIISAIGLDDNSDRVRLAKTMIEQEFEKLAIEINAGSVNGRIHFIAWRGQDAMLSSLNDEKFGKLSFQKEVSLATLGPNVSVFVNKSPQVPDFADTVGHGVLALGRGLAQDVEVWNTYPGAFDLGGDPSPDTSELMHALVIPAFGDAILGADGPGFWFGQTSNPRVWQHENVSIAIYKPDTHQKELSGNTHAHWPWDAFDEVRTETRNNGRWMFGRRDRRFPPCTPSIPDPAMRPSDETQWPVFKKREESTSGSGYVALFCAAELKTSPASARGWGHKELYADGDDNIWITIVGDRSVYGSFDSFVSAVLDATLDVRLNKALCSITLPKPGGTKGPNFKLTWEDGPSVDGKAQGTGDWPRFELKASTLKDGAKLGYGVNSVSNPDQGFVKFDETSWRIDAVTQVTDKDDVKDFPLFVVHDFSDLKNPKRDLNEMPGEPTGHRSLAVSALAAAIALNARSVLGQQFRPHQRIPAAGPIPRRSNVRRIH